MVFIAANLLIGLVFGALMGGILWVLSHRARRLQTITIDDMRQQLHSAQQTIILLEERARVLGTWESRAHALQEELQRTQGEAVRLKAELGHAETRTVEQRKALEQAEEKFTQAFKALSSDALAQNNRAFLALAQSVFEKTQQAMQHDITLKHQSLESLLKPVGTALTQMGEQMQHLEKSRIDAYSGLKQQVHDLLTSQKELRGETTQLVRALKAPAARGRWGEIQLRRVVEMAGMIQHCDFNEQVSQASGEGLVRPDMIVNLPGGKQIIVDAKTPLSAYLEALDAPDEATRLLKLQEHAAQVRTHVQQLSAKSYWSQFEATPEFVVLFLPGEPFFSAALEHDPTLIEVGVKARVLIATPTTLIALLRATAYGWHQEQIAESAQEISRLGQELFKRLQDMGGHINRVGRHLGAAVDAYNQTVGTLERRVMVSARRFQDLGGASSSSPLPELQSLDHSPRTLLHDAASNEIQDTETAEAS